MKIKPHYYIVLFITLIIQFSLVHGLYAQTSQSTNMQSTNMQSPENITDIPKIWHGLINRLANDGLAGVDINLAFSELDPMPSQSPMGRKIQELYSNKFIPKPKPEKGKKPKAKIYKNVVNNENVQQCQAFLQIHKKSFDYIERTYAVPREIAVSLLFVETRLGTWVGKDSAFFTLASMAQSTEIDNISTWLPKLKGYESNITWINQTMVKRSDWAYKELYALLEYTRNNNINPAILSGSIYGAIGLCQFMPSNIEKYGADGNGDGKINLFVEADAIASLAKYLSLHGWKKGISRQKQHKVLKTYNRINIYANTILALNDLILSHNDLKITVN